MNKKNNFWYVFLILLILLLAGTIRFYNINERGLIEWDESYYFGVAKTYRVVFGGVIESVYKNNFSIIKQRLSEEGISYLSGGKPGFILILFLGSFLLGINPNLPLIISIIFGLATIYLTGRISSLIFNKLVGLFSMLFLAVSFFHVNYSRSGFPTSVSIFFVYLGLLFYILSKRSSFLKSKKQIFYSGFFIGYAFTVHYNLYWVPVLLFLFLMWDLFKSEKVFFSIKKIVLFSCGSIIPILFFEIVTRVAKFFIYRSQNLTSALRGGMFLSYFEELLYLKEGKTFLTSFSPSFLKLIMDWEGSIILFLLISSLVWFVFNIKKTASSLKFLCFFFVIIPIMIWGSFKYLVARNIAIVVPVACMIFSTFFYSLLAKIKRNSFFFARILTSVTVMFVVLGGLWNLHPLLELRSGMPDAFAFMQKEGSIKHLSSDFYSSRIYAGRKNVLDTIVFSEEDVKKRLSSLYGEGYKFILLGGSRLLSNEKLLKYLENTKPVFIAPHPIHFSIYDSYAHAPELHQKVLSEPEKLYVYSIKELIKTK